MYPVSAGTSLFISPLVLVFATASTIFAVVFAVHKQRGCRCFPLDNLGFGLAVCQGVLVLQICCWVTLEGVSDEAKVPFFILLEAH